MHVLIAVVRALRGATVPMIDRCVIVALADRANASGKCWPSLARIAKDIDASRRGVIDSVKRLVALGLVKAERRPTGGLNGADSTVYTIDADELLAALKAGKLTGEPDAPVQDVHQCTARTSAGDAPQVVNQVHQTGEPGAPEDPHGRSPVEDPHPPEGASAPAKGRKAKKSKPKKASTNEATPEEHAARGRVLGADTAGYLRARGVKPIDDGGKRAAMALRLVRLVKGDGDAAVALVEQAYAHDYWGSRVDLADIVAKPDRFRGAPGVRKSPVVQSSAGRGWTPRVQGGSAGLADYERMKAEREAAALTPDPELDAAVGEDVPF